MFRRRGAWVAAGVVLVLVVAGAVALTWSRGTGVGAGPGRTSRRPVLRHGLAERPPRHGRRGAAPAGSAMQAEYAAAVAGLGHVTPSVRLASVHRRGATATASVAVTWPLGPNVAWAYTAPVTLAETGGRWTVRPDAVSGASVFAPDRPRRPTVAVPHAGPPRGHHRPRRRHDRRTGAGRRRRHRAGSGHRPDRARRRRWPASPASRPRRWPTRVAAAAPARLRPRHHAAPVRLRPAARPAAAAQGHRLPRPDPVARAHPRLRPGPARHRRPGHRRDRQGVRKPLRRRRFRRCLRAATPVRRASGRRVVVHRVGGGEERHQLPGRP